MPIVAIFWGVIDGEVLSLKQYVATIIILSGVYLVNNKQKTILKSLSVKGSLNFFFKFNRNGLHPVYNFGFKRI